MTVVTENRLFLDAARGAPTARTPVWLMRQAGRFDPAYRALRERCGLRLEEMFRQPELGAEITLLPRRFGVDALILFQDILTPTTPMGAPFVFRPGPALEHPIRTERDVDALRPFDPGDELGFVEEAIRLVQAELDGARPLLGFAGAPLTVAAFMIEGGSPGGQLVHTRVLMRDRPDVMHRLLAKLTDVTVEYLRMQVDAGVDAFQLFESCAALLTDEEYRDFARPCQAAVLQRVDRPVPSILYVNERDGVDAMAETGADVLSVGTCVDLAAARARLGERVALQGNVDRLLLLNGTPAEIEAAVASCLAAGGGRGHILNLSGGLHKDTPFDNVMCLLEACRNAPPRDDAPGGEGA